MATPIITRGATMLCPHGGTVNVQAANPRVRATQQEVSGPNNVFVITGCPRAVPCLTVKFNAGFSVRVLLQGQPALLQNTNGLCFDAAGIPTGPVVVAATQVRVKGT